MTDEDTAMKSEKALDFLKRRGMNADTFEPDELSEHMLKEMRYGLANFTRTVPMIPTYLRAEGTIEDGASAIVIDAGGTNFRTAVVTFKNGGYEVTDMKKKGMPGVGRSASWQEFISFVVDDLMPIIDRSDDIGFCFSYAADSTPDRDAIAHPLTKEVVLTEIEGKPVGASVLEELKRRGVTGKRITVLNDTPAVLLGTGALIDRTQYDSIIGMVSGTGMNACCIVPDRDILKLGLDGDNGMIINLEAATFSDVPRGEMDEILDRESTIPGNSRLEKMTAGVYLGELVRITLNTAADDGELSEGSAEEIRALRKIDSAVIDAWASGEKLDSVTDNADDAAFVQTVCLEIFRRAALGDCACLLAILKLTGKGVDKPVLICAEGSLVQKGRHLRPALEALLHEYAEAGMGRKIKFVVSEETTLPGSAAAALFNK